jgi:hypothetical protein
LTFWEKTLENRFDPRISTFTLMPQVGNYESGIPAATRFNRSQRRKGRNCVESMLHRQAEAQLMRWGDWRFSEAAVEARTPRDKF